MKRFYKAVTSHPESGVVGGHGFSIRLDGKPVKTPSGQVLLAPNEALAQAIVQEWMNQDADILPDSMPLTQILVTAQDRVMPERDTMEAMIRAYLDTDLVCYQVDEPAALSARQGAAWGPARDWFSTVSGVELLVTNGLQPLRQDDSAHDYVRCTIAGMNTCQFTVLQLVTVLSGSVILGLSFTCGFYTPADVFNAANVEEIYRAGIYNEDFYGTDPHQEKQRALMRADLTAARAFLDHLES